MYETQVFLALPAAQLRPVAAPAGFAPVLADFSALPVDRSIFWLGLAAAGLIVAILLIIEIRRPNAAERERRRRLKVNRIGRMCDCVIFDAEGAWLHYSYSVHGVSYSASQDVSSLLPLIPGGVESVVGQAHAKYDPHTPSNSIVICEDWSGLRPHACKEGAGAAAAPKEADIP